MPNPILSMPDPAGQRIGLYGGSFNPAHVGHFAVSLAAFTRLRLDWVWWLVSPQNPYDLAQIDILDSKLPPGSPSGAGGTFWLGTDDQGRDMLSAIFYGLRISLAVGVISTVLALVIAGPWIGSQLARFTAQLLQALPQVAS